MFPSPSSVAFEPEYEPVWFSKERVVLTWHDQDHNEALQDHTESDIDAYPQGYASCTMLDYLDTKCARTAINVDTDLDHRHARKRKRARHEQGEGDHSVGDEADTQAKHQGPRTAEDDAPPPAYEQVQVPASDCIPTSRSSKCRDASNVPTTPPNQGSCTDSSFSLNPLDTPDSPPLGPPFSPRVNPPQRLPLHDTQLDSQTNHRSDINIALHAAFVTWLLHMGRLQPYLHEDPELYTMLVAFGLVVQRGDITCFPSIKVIATSLVLKRHVTSPVEIRTWDMPAKKLVQRLAINVTQNSQASAADREDEYLFQEATCVANFFVTYALPLSRHLKTEIILAST
ncbi:hypothetical protein E4T50_02427 [Aureobasidium sp. EXF-12298]|nr:hypothetical protein E4T50_02427 [Aureobasidium sp. EXF-12298]KAI4764035.1 hypothetical protein E4T51_02977 [Aureobasidium sp. EXF-12344]KAI4780909.1 hypothetical protein E4T52_04125 [Aureobasidium sp. EXF-3400]